jgi:hypothetical protein
LHLTSLYGVDLFGLSFKRCYLNHHSTSAPLPHALTPTPYSLVGKSGDEGESVLADCVTAWKQATMRYCGGFGLRCTHTKHLCLLLIMALLPLLVLLLLNCCDYPAATATIATALLLLLLLLLLQQLLHSTPQIHTEAAGVDSEAARADC